MRALARAVQHLNEQKWMEAHEAFESVWRAASGPRKTLAQVGAVWAAALVKAERKEPVGVEKLFAKAVSLVGELPDSVESVDVQELNDAVLDSWRDAKAGTLTARWPAPRPVRTLHVVETEHTSSCPWCGEPVMINVAPEDAAASAQYVEDCPVCCRPWQVTLSLEGDDARAQLSRA